MKMHRIKTKATCLLLCFFTCTVQLGCKKLIAVDEPINTLTTTELFSSDATATSAMAGIYTVMINGSSGGSVPASAGSIFSAGLTTTLGAESSDELYIYNSTPNSPGSISNDAYRSNHLTITNSSSSAAIWTSAYDIIYKSNSVIEGIAASTATTLHSSVRTELTAEAKFTRAFSYFYLTNFFGDVPMALTVDFNKTENLPRMPQQLVYQQIIADLKEAQAGLKTDYSAGNGERVIPNKWAATLLLARAYLYTGDYASAATQATAVINNNSMFALEPDLRNVFSTTSKEAVWQLKQTTSDPTLKNGTPEGFVLGPGSTDHHGAPGYCLTDQLLAAFEPGDQRRVKWLDSADNADYTSPIPETYCSFKYSISSANADASQQPPQYYMVLRLAEAYLIRAEAEANGKNGGTAAAIADLNVIRNRAGLPNLDSNLTQQQVIAAVAQERRVEFFAEWGHRWFDLKRTGQAHSVLSVIPAKQPWAGDYQLLYPIPQSEITIDHFLSQNTDY
ncbi:RagB/SusD family nutrient uptake outer membrane protein [Mucilaginibacter sp.]|uniref:RagB/SusD family nutrient uptake outer membrane protein n=1 Tax=Mucilaginibacter sp. TaxID=1882438 RepID=UPI00283DD49F|nr:RagB/SusD family nutrient uptake outer membrane protein [Mucilaginibacter sp.]MDR3697040.1 RagB/SusD family nutrient uptake outer membrane protein [Mucilaginibacter sp.]